MLKGRDLNTEKYYSKENIEKLRDIYLTKIYPKLWTDTASVQNAEELAQLREELAQLKGRFNAFQAISTVRYSIS